jgi:catechol 2,3-dioxygenase-like lactoylglutathione lyase family enzyme
MHLSFATRDLAAGVAFYTTLLDAEPAKRFDDDALFVTDRPGLELALDLDPRAVASPGGHFGLVAESVAAVDAQAERLRSAAYRIDIERAETCCYANQTKVWARDPDGRRWETYVVHADTQERESARTSCCR